MLLCSTGIGPNVLMQQSSNNGVSATVVKQSNEETHLCRVANIATTGMKAHDNLDLQAKGLHKVKKLPIACPVVPLWLPLN